MGLKVSLDSILLTDLPFPPSDNHIYAGKSKRYKSKDAKYFASLMNVWHLQHRAQVLEARQIMLGWDEIYVSLYLGFREDRLWTKDGKRKKIDASNRDKLMHDYVSEMLGVDDRDFWGCTVWKAPLDPSDKRERCAMYLTPAKGMWRFMLEIEDHYGRENDEDRNRILGPVDPAPVHGLSAVEGCGTHD